MFTRLKKIKIFLFILILSLVIVFVGKIAAQPGETRSFEEIEKDLLNQLANTNENLKDNLVDYENYVSRGEIYYSLFLNKASRKGINDENYGKNATADFTKAIELVPQTPVSSDKNSAVAAILSDRARLYATVWEYEFYRIPETDIQSRLIHIYKSEKFNKAVNDYEKAISLAADSKSYSLYLSNFYKFRGEIYNYSPELLKEIKLQNQMEKIWQDFDLALKYAEASVDKKYGKGETVEILLEKGKIAFEAGEYDIALNAYLSDEKYLGKNYEYFCGKVKGESLCNSDKRVIKYTFSFRRATVYVKTKKPEKALTEMEVFFENVFHRSCPEPFLLRAKIYRQLGKIELAEADEIYAQNLPPLSLNACNY